MEFKLIQQKSPEIEKLIFDYCLLSKPYYFCQNKSKQLSAMKIKEYIDYLFNTATIYVAREKGEFFLFLALSFSLNAVCVEFIFGNSEKPQKSMNAFKEFRRKFFIKNPHCEAFVSAIHRKYKVDKYVKFVKRYDKDAKIELDKNNELMIYWSKDEISK